MRFLNKIIFSSVFLLFFSLPLAFAEGGGGIECPQTSGVFTFIPGSAIYNINSFEVGEIGILFCEYETESHEVIEPFGEINAIFHVSGDLSQDLIDEYGCGAILGEQFSSTYVSSETHFASVAFSTDHLVEAAGVIMAQIETNDLATGCIQAEVPKSTADIVKQVIEEHEVIEDETEEILQSEIVDTLPPISTASELGIVLPDWIKKNAEWWSSGQITDIDFADGIEYMINQGYIKIPSTEASETPETEIPDWVKNNAEWWSQDQITDKDFVNGLQFLISNGIIVVA